MDLGELIISDSFEEGNNASITQMGWGWWLIWLGILVVTVGIIIWGIMYVHRHRKRLQAGCDSGNKKMCAQLAFNVK